MPATAKLKKKSKRTLGAEKLIEEVVVRHEKLGVDRRGASIYMGMTADGLKTLKQVYGAERIDRWILEQAMQDAYLELESFCLRYTEDGIDDVEGYLAFRRTFSKVLDAFEHMEVPTVEPLL